MFVPPRHPDDPATFNLWTEGGKFRGLTGDESSWIQRVTQCTSILQTSPFIVLYGAHIKTYRTLGGQPVAYGSNPNPAKRGTIGNPRMADPMTDFVGLDVFTSVALAFLLEAIPAKVKFVVEFWSTLLIQIEGTIDRPSLPGRVAGRVALYFNEASKIFPSLNQQSVRQSGIPDCAAYDPVHSGIRITSSDKTLSTTLGAFIRHSDGRRRFMVALHGFPNGGTIFHPFDERAIGAIKEAFPTADIALAEVAGGVAADHHDYFGITPPQRMARMAECQYGNYASADSWVSGPVDFLVTGKYIVVGEDHWGLQLLSESGLLVYQTNELPDGIYGSTIVQEDFPGHPSWVPSLLGQYRYAAGEGLSVVPCLDPLKEAGWDV